MMVSRKGWLAVGLLAWSLSAGLAAADDLPPPPEGASAATEASQAPAQDTTATAAPQEPAQDSSADK